MPKGIEKSDWDKVHELACDIANAAIIDEDIIVKSRTEALLEVLGEMRKKYGDHPAILGSIGDYLDDRSERMRFYSEALDRAKKLNLGDEIIEIQDSIDNIDE